MHPHDYLLAVIITLTQPVISGITAPLGINGFLKKKLGYEFRFSAMGEAQNKEMSLPDGLIFNEATKTLLIPECKSSLQEKDAAARLSRQLQCYSSQEFLAVIRRIIPDFNRAEIVIVTYPEVAKEIQLFLNAHSDELNSLLNIVIWTVNRIPETDRVLTKLFEGKHLDENLNAAMVNGVESRPPAREFLSSPDIPNARFASVIGRRLLVSIVTGTKTFTVEDFLNENKDLAISLPRLRKVFSALFHLVPELGSFERKSSTVKLKTRVDFVIVQNRLSEIGQMSSAEFHKRIGEPPEGEKLVVKAPEPEKPTKQASLMDFSK